MINLSKGLYQAFTQCTLMHIVSPLILSKLESTKYPWKITDNFSYK